MSLVIETGDLPFEQDAKRSSKRRRRMRFSHLRPRNFITDLGNAPAAAAQNRRWDDDIVVSHLGEAGLPAPSVIRCAKIATIAAQGAERIGVLARSDRGKVTAHLARILADAGSARARRK